MISQEDSPTYSSNYDAVVSFCGGGMGGWMGCRFNHGMCKQFYT